MSVLGAIGGIVGGIGSLVTGSETASADEAEGEAFQTAAQFANLNAFYAGQVGGLQEMGLARKIQQTQGTQAATAAGNGLQIGGSALARMRDTVSQGALAEGQVGLQTTINVTQFQGQAEADLGMAQAAQAQAQAAQTGGIFGLFGGILGGIAKLF
jgi:hypothetical protein